MLLGYPLDFKDATMLVEVCTPFAKVLHWNSEDSSMSRVLLKVLVEDMHGIPRDVVIKMGHESDGDGHSWTVPIYIFNSGILSAGPFDEGDPPENNGDPHPFHGPVLPSEQQQIARLADQYMEEILQHNPFPVVAVPDQGYNMGPLSRNLANDAIVVVLDLVVYKARMLCKKTILALPAQSQGQDMLTRSNSVDTMSQLVISGSYKIKTLAKADGNIAGSSVVLPGGVEFNVIVPDRSRKLFCLWKASSRKVLS
jgi:hypothetical protein